MLGARMVCCLASTCCRWYRRRLGIDAWVSDEMGNRGGDHNGFWFQVPFSISWLDWHVHLYVARLALLVSAVSIKLGVSSSCLMDAIRSRMVKPSYVLRYGLATFEGDIFVQVMPGASRCLRCGSEWGSPGERSRGRTNVECQAVEVIEVIGNEDLDALLHLGNGRV